MECVGASKSMLGMDSLRLDELIGHDPLTALEQWKASRPVAVVGSVPLNRIQTERSLGTCDANKPNMTQ